ncbi:MAG TPA: nucleotide-binding protein [Methanoregulaceae archaeon]|nr:MAG: nucleotide-binding protein [Methanolinea sp.]HON81460.1 nucleotide-binding protein [Methanoregulaceae archaeon]HPD10012.1 nucleotide-binding protein [Methanoregulaceae archaeon]HRT15018.1 nucleotide-binding protein [Methanoregulaceae archaeon]HRU30589.1 nucleotide-binding protein [Methanoregulaceae archaeon]
MKIGEINLKITPIALAVVAIFTIFLAYAFFVSRDTHILFWGIPTLVLLLVIPLGLNYMSQKEYADMIPQYEREARPVRIRMINLNMVGEPVRIEGVVERIYFQFLNRPQFLVADRSGEISVKMFTSPQEKIRVGDVVEVLGMVIKRYIAGGDAVINGISIRKIEKTIKVREKPKKP